tara:strand:+ start:8747 stop:9841 length:1095 start_codon:yes stop_codon:yes gene_type:complete
LNYKETFYFVAKCLTISLEEKNRDEIESVLKSGYVDWEEVVKVSTSHYVLPAIYCNLKRTNFLKYLPNDLSKYMQYITKLNRDRNIQVLKQSEALNKLLLANNIRPIFLKGTGNLIAGIYEDIAERMIGDIDFILSKKNYQKVIKILRGVGYCDVNKYHFPGTRHYNRLQKEDSIASVEIHKELLGKTKYANEFNYNFVKKDSQKINIYKTLSYANKLNLSIISNQINDLGYYYKAMPLRNAYDVFLLSKKTNSKEAINTLDKLTIPLNCFLAVCYKVFNEVDCLEYNRTKNAASYFSAFNRKLTNSKARKILYKLIKGYLFLKSGLYIFYMAIIKKEYRTWLFKRVTDKNWQKKKLAQLGFKK